MRPAVTALRRDDGETVLHTAGGAVQTRFVIACAGLHSDRVAALTGTSDAAMRIVPFRGDYYTVRRIRARLVSGLIYPVPDPTFPFLGIHVSRRIDGRVLRSERGAGVRPRRLPAGTDSASATWPAFSPLPGLAARRRNLRTGAAELWRDLVTSAFVRPSSGICRRSNPTTSTSVPPACAARRSPATASSSTISSSGRTERAPRAQRAVAGSHRLASDRTPPGRASPRTVLSRLICVGAPGVDHARTRGCEPEPRCARACGRLAAAAKGATWVYQWQDSVYNRRRRRRR